MAKILVDLENGGVYSVTHDFGEDAEVLIVDRDEEILWRDKSVVVPAQDIDDYIEGAKTLGILREGNQ
jgi:hypothetical protein